MGLQVGQVVGPVLAVLAGEDVLARVNLLMVSQPPPLAKEAGPVAAERTLNGWSEALFLVISARIMSLGLGTAVRLSGETGKAAHLHHPPGLRAIAVFQEVVLHSLAEVTLVITQTAGVLLHVLVDILIVYMIT